MIAVNSTLTEMTLHSLSLMQIFQTYIICSHLPHQYRLIVTIATRQRDNYRISSRVSETTTT